VSVVVPFRDKAEVTDRCLRSLETTRGELPLELILVDNGSREPATQAAIAVWQARWPSACILRDDRPFNFQAINNAAASVAQGELLLFLNNDTEAIYGGWIEAMAEHAQRAEIGAVGARLFYPNGLVQHAGVAVGIGGFADHPWSGLHPDDSTPAGPSYWVRNFLGVTAACLMVDHRKFDQVAGFDERFTVCGGDVDLGLRLYEAGFWNVMTPFARLIHHESVSRDRIPPVNDEVESRRAYQRYLKGGDPFYNPNLTRADTSCRISAPPFPGRQG
jgi:GT2 family glycosyltransferase